MGDDRVNSIPTEPDEYQKLDLQNAEQRFHKIENHETDSVLEEAFSNRMAAFPNYHPTEYDYWAVSYYTIDLDLEVFLIDSSAHYRLDCIPRNCQWIKAVLLDGKGNRFVHPQFAPEASLASLAVTTQQSKTGKSMSLAKREVIPKLPDPSNTFAKFQLKLFNLPKTRAG
ncbi:MAG: hypothetical protein Q9199_000655 [Rusavskia elegans]